MAAVGDVRCMLLIVGAGLLWEQEILSSNLGAPTKENLPERNPDPERPTSQRLPVAQLDRAAAF